MKADTLSKREIEYYRKLWTTQGQRKYSKFAVEGIRIVNEAITATDVSDYPVEEVLVDPIFTSKTSGEAVVIASKKHNIPVRFVKRSYIETILKTKTPQGVMAVLNMPAKSDDARLGDFMAMKGVVLFLDGVQDPGNAGTLIRSAAAFGVEGVIIGQNGARLYNPKVVRASAGAFLQIPVIDLTHRDATEIVEKFVSSSFQIVITSTDSDAKPITKATLPNKAMIVIGNEGIGVRETIKKLSSKKLSIPILSKVDSLNAAVAGSIILFHFLVK